MAQVIIDDEHTLFSTPIESSIVYCSARLADQPSFHGLVSHALSLLPEPERAILVIHNGDIKPEVLAGSGVEALFTKVYCVNVVSETPDLRALPIGLENVALNRNGRMNYYLEPFFSPQPVESRTRRVLSSFHIATNRAMRAGVARTMSDSRHGHEQQFFRSAEYRQVVLTTKFVISPPGNGADCHRTWEALYLGAVPVTLSGFLAPSLVESLPILQVSSYEEFCALSDSELEEIFQELRRRPMAKALAHYWSKELAPS